MQSSELGGVVDVIRDKRMLVTVGTVRVLHVYGICNPLERTETRLGRITPRAMCGKGRSHLKSIYWICSSSHVGLGVEVSVILTRFRTYVYLSPARPISGLTLGKGTPRANGSAVYSDTKSEGWAFVHEDMIEDSSEWDYCSVASL